MQFYPDFECLYRQSCIFIHGVGIYPFMLRFSEFVEFHFNKTLYFPTNLLSFSKIINLLPCQFILSESTRDIRNTLESHLQSRKKSLPAPPSGREWATSLTANVGWDLMNPGIRIYISQVPTPFSEGGWASRGHGNLLSLRWETILEGRWTISWPTVWRCVKETGIITHCYFPWKDLKFYIKKEENK